MADSFNSGMYPSGYDSPDQHVRMSRPSGDDLTPLTTRECLELIQEVVEATRHENKQKLGIVEEGAQASKLTAYLNNQRIRQLPVEGVAHIKPDVERLQLSHNQLRDIPLEYSSCSVLKYLNLRFNRFTEIPPVIFNLQQLEIIDFSHNFLTCLPKELECLKNLRVLGFKANQIQDLPLCLGNISTLRVLKCRENPLRQDLLDIIKHHDDTQPPTTPSPADTGHKEVALTGKLTTYLKDLQSMSDDASDEPLETPRAMSRFPKPSGDSGYLTSGSESASGSRSPGLTRSTRTHLRGASSQYVSAQSLVSRRPGLAPLALNNDRNRSTSETTLQTTQNTKNKRMGMVTKKNKELQVVEESKAQRNSFHLRGQSHNSALKHVVHAGDISPSDENGRTKGQTPALLRRLSSLPERKQDVQVQDEVMECAKGLLYSLHSVQSSLISMAALVKENSPKRSSLERFQHQASVQLEYLDHSLRDLSLAANKSRRAWATARQDVCRASHACIDMYGQIAGILLRNINQLMMDGDMKYIRTLLLLLYGSINEQRNARRKLAATLGPEQTTLKTAQSNMSTSSVTSVNRDDALTPTQHGYRPGRQLENGNRMQYPLNQANLASVLNKNHFTQTSSTMSSRTDSRSSSRAGFYYHQPVTSAMNTPRSIESFSSSLYTPRSRAGSTSANAERQRQAQMEQLQFEKIFDTLWNAAEQGLAAIHYLQPRFNTSRDAARRQWTPGDITKLWETIVKRAQLCNGTSESLKYRLQSMKIDDVEARNAPDFWYLVKRFGNAYSNLIASLRQARKVNQMDPNLRHKLYPIQKLVVEAVTSIKSSPWEKISNPSQPASVVPSRAPTPVQNGYPRPVQHQMLPPKIPNPSMAAHQHYQHRRPNGSTGSNGSTNDNAKSPYNTSVPPTPLSAALGPAAQATIPSTPASASGSMAGMFEGDIFQRADALLQGQTMFRRPAGAP